MSEQRTWSQWWAEKTGWGAAPAADQGTPQGSASAVADVDGVATGGRRKRKGGKRHKKTKRARSSSRRTGRKTNRP